MRIYIGSRSTPFGGIKQPLSHDQHVARITAQCRSTPRDSLGRLEKYWFFECSETTEQPPQTIIRDRSTTDLGS